MYFTLGFQYYKKVTLRHIYYSIKLLCLIGCTTFKRLEIKTNNEKLC